MRCTCGSVNPGDAIYCQECGKKLIDNENDYELATGLGIIGVIFFLPLALLCGVYLYTRHEETAKTTGKRMILISIFIWALFFILIEIF